MYARSTEVHGDPKAIKDGVAYLTDRVLPTLERSEGCVGLSMLADPESGRCIATTSWSTEEAMRATTERLRSSRTKYAVALGGSDPEMREWEIAILHRKRPAGDEASAQVTWARIQPNHLQDLLDAYRINLMPKLEDLPGFCSLSMMVDRRNGRTVSVTCFESREALDLVRKHARMLREQFAQAMGAKIHDVAEMNLVLAHLGVPETT
jgi:heme-degrading monooxygenase HmoA